jgi:N-acetyl sugar amidotransferase
MSTVHCKRCILSSTDDPLITFDSSGVCSICNMYDARKNRFLPFQKSGDKALNGLIQQIKSAGRNSDYDCIIGLSGGTDSTYVAWLAKHHGLRPLAVHLDNGWNSELAVINVQRVLDALRIDLFTYVIDWDEFKDLQRSYIKASVIDIEALTDHAITATLYKAARKFKVKYVLTGESFETEGILPPSWVHIKLDHTNIISIHRRFGNLPMKTFPIMNYFNYLYLNKLNSVTFLPILNYLPYNKKEVKEIITREMGWKDYGGKHHESIFTRFYQTYILPKKFGVDKRKAHLSTLICAGQISREEAIKEMGLPICDPKTIIKDKVYVLKKLGFSEEEFDYFMSRPAVPHTAYPSVIHTLERLKKFLFWTELSRIKTLLFPNSSKLTFGKR